MSPNRNSSTTEKDWDNTWRFQFGVEYALTNFVDLRASYVYDQTPIPSETIDYLVPTDDYHIFGAGVGFTVDKVTLDASYQFLFSPDRGVEARPEDGVFDSEIDNSHTHIVGVSISYDF